MKYARIKPEADNIRRKDGSIYVKGELYTLKEADKLGISKSLYDIVEVSKSAVYFFCGARFEK